MHDSIYTRREILAGGAGGAAAVLLAACGGTTANRAAAVKPAGSDLGAIDHVVFLMQENRSFDHYYGTFPGVRGFDDHPAGDLGNFAQPWPANTDDRPRPGQLLPFHLDTARTLAECTFDLSHAWTAQHQCWNHGKMDAFVTTHTMPQYEGPMNGVITMGYYTAPGPPLLLRTGRRLHPVRRLPLLGARADASRTGSSGCRARTTRTGKAGGPVIITSSSTSAQWSSSWPTMPERARGERDLLEGLQPSRAAISAVSSGGCADLEQHPDALQAVLAIPPSALYQKAFLSAFPNDFASDVAKGTLPAGLLDRRPHRPKGPFRAPTGAAGRSASGSPIRC